MVLIFHQGQIQDLVWFQLKWFGLCFDSSWSRSMVHIVCNNIKRYLNLNWTKFDQSQILNSNHHYCWSLLFKKFLWSTWFSSNSIPLWYCWKQCEPRTLIIMDQNKVQPISFEIKIKAQNAFGEIIKTWWQIKFSQKLWNYFYKIKNIPWAMLNQFGAFVKL